MAQSTTASKDSTSDKAQQTTSKAERYDAKKGDQQDEKLGDVLRHRDELVTENEALKRAGKKNDKAAEKLEKIEEILKS